MPGEVTFVGGLQQVTAAADGDTTASTSNSATWHQKLRSSSPFGKSTQMSKEDIVAHGKCLCGQYMRARLRRAGCLNRKVTQRLRTLLDPCTTLATRDIFPTLNAMGEELERMHPRLYTNVSRQLSSPGSPPFGELIDADAAPFLLHATAKELFKTGTATGSPNASNNGAAVIPDISWGKIVSLFAVCAALAVDIVRQGHYDYLPRLLESTADIIEEDLAAWIQQVPSAQQSHAGALSPSAATMHRAGGGGGGGWSGLVEYIQVPRVQQASVTDVLCSNWMSVAVCGIVTLYGAVQAVRWLGDWCWHLWIGDGL